MANENDNKLVDLADLKTAFDDINDIIKKTVIAESTTRTIVNGTSTYSLLGLTVNHRVVYWGFSGSYSENNPPADITVTTASGSYTVTASNLATNGITMQPIFAAAHS